MTLMGHSGGSSDDLNTERNVDSRSYLRRFQRGTIILFGTVISAQDSSMIQSLLHIFIFTF